MQVTATEFKNNIGKYLSLVSTEDILITKNGKNIAKLSSAKQSKVDIVRSLIGSVPNDGFTLQDAREERMRRYESTD
ncbi:MAG: type II toxin-antitoxin system prevent-host-death family antitoxin [Oscillospiraceae bacterium]|jgi:prevent-host-death family protein|nr:type II toxin-antitoxin system prevent-host-death family antitoxin [Oscillospiraceae bacterium]